MGELARGSTRETGRQCSLCGYVLDERGRPALIKTRGCWVAHASCLASLPVGGRSVQGPCNG
jgi:hypothetical protein